MHSRNHRQRRIFINGGFDMKMMRSAANGSLNEKKNTATFAAKVLMALPCKFVSFVAWNVALRERFVCKCHANAFI